MAVLEELLGQMLGGNTGSNHESPIPGMMSSLFQGLPGGTNASGASGVTGLSGLIGQFEAAGLGHVVQSWIGNGPNAAIGPDQLQRVLGPDRVNGMAQSSGMEPSDLLTQLSQLLPGLVDRMTPQGHLPGAGHEQVPNPFGQQSGGTPASGDDPWGGTGRDG